MGMINQPFISSEKGFKSKPRNASKHFFKCEHVPAARGLLQTGLVLLPLQRCHVLLVVVQCRSALAVKSQGEIKR